MKIFEIGVGEYWQCRTRQHKGSEIECWLFEPNPISYREISKNLGAEKNYKLHNCAVGSENKKINLFLAKGSSFVEGSMSPELCHNKNSASQLEKVEVQMIDIRDVDNGDIDLLLLDMEGGEFDVIKNLKSRPNQIFVEMYSFGVGYKNPNFENIMDWMTSNNYFILQEGEDFIFQKK
jgi:FkbM family methyltransferase